MINLSAIEIVHGIKSGKFSVEETVNSFLDHIDKCNPAVNAVVALRDRKEIIAEAQEKDLLLKNNKETGLLFGLPMTIKDIFSVEGLVVTAGNPFYKNNIATEDAELIRRIKAEGAIIIGKTNLPIFSFDWQSVNSWYGQTNNPYDLSKVPGGSSGGSAASVAAKFSPLELGSDAGGSIRVPASFCGIYGLRPTEHALSNRGHGHLPGIPQGGRHIIVAGPLARNMNDLELLLKVLWKNERHYPEIPPVSYNNSDWDGTKLNIAYAKTINDIEVDAEIVTALNGFIEKLQGTEHKVSECSVEFSEEKAYLTHNTIIGTEVDAGLPTYLPFKKTGVYLYFYSRFKDHIMAKGLSKGIRLSPKNYAKALDYKDYFSQQYADFLTEYDIWITPVCATLPFSHRKTGKSFTINNKKVKYVDALGKFTFTTALAGHPILVIPIGKSKSGLPIGIQIHARKWSDNKLIKIGKYLSGLTDGYCEPDFDNYRQH